MIVVLSRVQTVEWIELWPGGRTCVTMQPAPLRSRCRVGRHSCVHCTRLARLWELNGTFEWNSEVWKPEVSCCSSALWHDRIVPVTSVSVVSLTLGSSQLSKCHSLECGTCLTAGIFPRWWLGLRFLWGRGFPYELEEAYIKKFFTVYFAGLESSFLSLTGLVATWATFDSEGRFKVLHKLLGGHLTWGGVPGESLCGSG